MFEVTNLRKFSPSKVSHYTVAATRVSWSTHIHEVRARAEASFWRVSWPARSPIGHLDYTLWGEHERLHIHKTWVHMTIMNIIILSLALTWLWWYNICCWSQSIWFMGQCMTQPCQTFFLQPPWRFLASWVNYLDKSHLTSWRHQS